MVPSQSVDQKSVSGPNRTKLKRGGVYLNFRPYSRQAARQSALASNARRRRRSAWSGQPRWQAGSAWMRVAVPLPPGRRRRRRPSPSAAGARGRQGAHHAPRRDGRAGRHRGRYVTSRAHRRWRPAAPALYDLKVLAKKEATESWRAAALRRATAASPRTTGEDGTRNAVRPPLVLVPTSRWIGLLRSRFGDDSVVLVTCQAGAAVRELDAIDAGILTLYHYNDHHVLR